MRRAAFWASVGMTVGPILLLGILQRALVRSNSGAKSSPRPTPVVPDDLLAQRYRGESEGHRLEFTFTSDAGAWLVVDSHVIYSGSVVAARAVLGDGKTEFEAHIGVDDDAALNVRFSGGPFDQRTVRIHPER